MKTINNIHLKIVASMCMLFLLFSGETSVVFGQQVGMYSHFFYKPMVYNPAFAGNADESNMMLLSRTQWAHFKGAPQLTLFTADGNIMDKKVGLGVSLINDKKGITSKTGGNVYYSYCLKLNDDMNIAFGAAVGVADQSVNFSKATVQNYADPTLYTDAEHKTAFEGNAGILFSWKELKVGASVPQLFANNLKSVSTVDSSTVNPYYTFVRHYMLSAQYKFVISDKNDISITPMGLVRVLPNTPLQYDAGAYFDWKDKFWAGATYKSNYALTANVGFYVHKQLAVGYAYDVIIGSISKYAGISHEIMVNFNWAKSKKQTLENPNTQNSTEAAVDYEEEINQLQNQLKKNQQKLKELSDKLDKKVQTPDVAEPSPDLFKPGSVSSDGVFVTSKKDFKNTANLEAESGYYVIVGIFFYRDFAEEEIKNFTKKGFPKSSLVYSESKKNNYVFVDKLTTKEEAFAKAKELNEKDSSNAWILYLTE